jgi:hypothetical protein
MKPAIVAVAVLAVLAELASAAEVALYPRSVDGASTTTTCGRYEVCVLFICLRILLFDKPPTTHHHAMSRLTARSKNNLG